ncbi:MAG: Adenine phosphoribosyltransferase [Candidatus Omnitrophica bacterium]|nr:Adenine phosphoribosyltransferase [Candidatus Omnitrophota bacterium]
MSRRRALRLEDRIREVPDFPKKGILFRDITPLLMDGEAFGECVGRMAGLVRGKVDTVLSIESRGFIFGSALANRLGIGFIPIRKQGKLPHKTYRMEYELEYGTAAVEIHRDALKKGARVVIVDDVLATGGTMKAAVQLARKCGARVTSILFLIELAALGGRRKLRGYPVSTLITY